MQNPSSSAQFPLPRLCRWALGLAVRRWPSLGAVVTAQLLRVGLDLLKPWPMVFLIDYVLRGDAMPQSLARLVAWLPGSGTPMQLIGWSVAATVLVFLLSWLVGLATTYSNISLGQRMTYDLAGELFAKLQQLSLHFHARQSVGDNIRRVTADCGCAAIMVRDALLPVFAAMVSVAAMFGILWQLNPRLTLLALAVVPYMLWVFWRYATPMMERSYAQQEKEGRIYAVVEQTFSSIPLMQAFGREDANERRFAGVAADALAVTLAATRVQLGFKIMMGLATALGTAGILWLGAHQALAGHLTIGAIIAFLSYLGALYAPLNSIMYAGSTIQGAAGSARRVLEVLQTETRVTDKPGAATLPRPGGYVRFENVTFGYEPDRPVLRELTLHVAPGQTLAIVGVTGAGKSTLVSLIPRFFDPWTGRVMVDNHDVRDVRLKSLRQNVAIVLQEPFLFPATVAENIAYGQPHATRAQIEAAARAAHAHEFIQRLPEGYQSVLGERGATLSGGERQRLAIARALLKNAPILILDEPTSALDAGTEQALVAALANLTRDRTTFIIAHRLSTIRRADRIIVLADGRIAESGTHHELLLRNGHYARFHALQSGVAHESNTPAS
jgi:ATP-binding cassette subfamily B protein/subfamily B ATP-binding cassette protein MsbA